MEPLIYWMGVGRYLAAAFAGFCLGGVLFSYHLPKLLKGVDVCRLSADGNPGTVNAFKYAGIPVGILCLLCDLCKGFVPVYLAARVLDPGRLWFALVLCAPVLGHAVAPLYHNRSGKAIAVSFGVLLGLLPRSFLVVVLVALYLFFSLILVVNPHERRTVAVFGLFAAAAFGTAFFTRRWSFAFGSVLLSAVVIAKNYRGAKVGAAPDAWNQDNPQEQARN